METVVNQDETRRRGSFLENAEQRPTDDNCRLNGHKSKEQRHEFSGLRWLDLAAGAHAQLLSHKRHDEWAIDEAMGNL